MKTNRFAATTAALGVAALAVTGVTYASAASEPMAPQASARQVAAPAELPADGGAAGGKGNEKGNNEGHHEKRHEEGRIHINERTYSAHSGGCITVISGLGAKTLNIRNDSHKTVEVFRGAVCDNGAPIATVGPHSTSDGVKIHHTKGIRVEDGIVGSFRVVEHRA
ncbi:hypothetical protein [Kitasatospora sp. NPDC087314]|uniref:hypothetical protein n=1 Tax=Kitasatospora sp. NPDC087314 TaxID=3364068 RepID=UPI00381DB29C